MKSHPAFFNKLRFTTPDEVFAYLRDTLKPRLAKPSYFVDWNKVITQTKGVEMSLHTLDYVLGQEDKAQALFEVIKRDPQVIEALPHIFASREYEFVLIPEAVKDYLEVDEYSFRAHLYKSDEDIAKVVRFCEAIGLLDFISKAKLSSFTDFVYGVEAGLDTHGRKNRGGTQMEEIVEYYVKRICDAHGYQYLTQASAPQIKRHFGQHVTVDKSTRNFDFAISTPHKLYLIETNFYGGGGSKLKATAGEYKGLYDLVKRDGHEFIWITDGKGWLTALYPLRENFNHTDYILNLDMINKGILEDIVTIPF